MPLKPNRTATVSSEETTTQHRKGANGRAKGSSFERLIAKDVIQTFACKGITHKDCYRTPLSGGHFAASKTDPGDLVTSPVLRKLFPYSVECKHYRKIELYHLMEDRAEKRRGSIPMWWRQCCKAADSCGLQPVLVFRQNGQEIMAMVRLGGKMKPSEKIAPYMVTDIGGERVMVMRWRRFLRLTRYHATGGGRDWYGNWQGTKGD